MARHAHHSWHLNIRAERERRAKLIERLRAQIEKNEREGKPTDGLRQMLKELTK